MAAPSLARLLIFASCLATVCGLQCYSCSREDNTDALQYCSFNSSALGNNTKVTCSSNDTQCVISKTILGNDTLSFTRKCVEDNECSNPGCHGSNGNGTYHCNSCCGVDLCNNGTGPPPPSPTESTPPQSGSSRIPFISSLCMFGSFLVCFLVYEVIMA